MVAVAESYDLTLWQEIITNIIHSAVVIVKWTQHHEHISQEEGGEGEAKSHFCPQLKMLIQNILLLMVNYFFKGFLLFVQN